MTVRDLKEVIADVPDEFEVFIEGPNDVACVVRYSGSIVLDQASDNYLDIIATSDVHFIYGG